MADPRISAQLSYTLRETRLPALGERYQGKVRDVYRKGDRLVLVTTDRLSAFDHVLTTIPFKGEVLNRLARFWFEKTAHVAKNHLLDVPDPNVAVARRCEAFAVEFVVRGYITGSLWRDYQRDAHSAYGLELPAGLRKDQAFERPILTPSTKAEYGRHDEPISEREIVARALLGQRDLERAKEIAFGLFAEGQTWARSRGLILVDTKYELGKVGDELYVIDEIHTPDSSRYWLAGEYQARFERGDDQRMLDKENIRQWLIKERGFLGHGAPPAIPDEVRVDLAEKYLSAFERITAERLQLQAGDVQSRMEENLRSRGYL
ncbi:MAG: phosphoribosylaminoimidazolesuccinocarboxamide synthase [Myxococcales bacterium]|nr:phosphoribosylaminoimidazolesuccinocarboxamide synthase [Myxococcales bacterium]